MNEKQFFAKIDSVVLSVFNRAIFQIPRALRERDPKRVNDRWTLNQMIESTQAAADQSRVNTDKILKELASLKTVVANLEKKVN